MSKRKRLSDLERRVQVLELALRIEVAKQNKPVDFPLWYPVRKV